MPGPTLKTPLVVFSDDWGRHPSSSQHLIKHLLPTREVLWVNTIGTRPLRLDVRTAQRVIEKLKHWAAPAASLPAVSEQGLPGVKSPHVISPRMWPSFSTMAARRLNKTLLAAALKPAIERLGEAPVVITTIPLMADLVGELPVKKWIYYCVDDFSVWPGYDGKTMGDMERQLVPRMSDTVAASESLSQGLRQFGAQPTLITHGVDLSMWQDSMNASKKEIAEFAGFQSPLIVFWGVLDRRMDVEWVIGLSQALETRGLPGSIVMFGPHEDPDPRLFKIPRVSLRPAVAFDRLPSIAAQADLLIMPYGDMLATRAMQPLKLKEYLATGLPVVVRDLPATRPWADACDVCESREQFIEAVISRLDSGVPIEQERARLRLEAESWRAKAEVLEQVIDNSTIEAHAALQS